ncbi:MAG: hypothetical protein WBD74_05080 [Candidatus Aquilonibacter sp.]
MGSAPRTRWAAIVFAAIISTAVATAAFAGVTTPRVNPPAITTRPIVGTSTRPIQTTTTSPRARVTQCAGINFKTLAKGAKIPRSCFGTLPAKTKLNTSTPKATAKGGRFHPLAATGATVDLTAVSNCGAQGAIYQIGCSLNWVATNLTDWSTTDAYQDWEIAPNSNTAVKISGANYAYNAAPTENTVLSIAGTYSFFVYDATKQVIVAIVYVDAGQSFQIGVYADPYHVTPSYQFSVVGDSDVYIYLPDVSTNDTYVVYVMSTSVNAYCVYITPAATPSPGPASPMPSGAPNALVCNPSNSVGINAPSGALSLAWPLSTSLQAGTYSIVVYDKTQQETMGQVQVSLNGISEYAFSLYPTPAAAASAQPTATPPGTFFAWDSSTEQSTGGIVASVPNQVSGTYRMTATDPDGQVVSIPAVNAIPATCTAANNSAANCIETGTFTFNSASPVIHPPGQYPTDVWTMQLINTANNTVQASQAFQMVGYSVDSEFDNAGTYGTTINFPSTGTINEKAGISLYLLNNGNIAFPNAYDTIKGIEYTTGPATSLTGGAFTALSNTAGFGITIQLPGGCSSGTYLTGCVEAVTDSAGKSWTLTDYCSTNTPQTPAIGSQCVLTIKPAAGVVLSATGSLTISLNWWADSGAGAWCPTPCTGYTSILPNDGLSWSNPSVSSAAWYPTYFSATNAAIIGTATAHYIGSATFPGNTSRTVAAFATSPPTTPWTNTHFYQSYFTQGDYQNDSPFAISAGREDVLVISLSDCIAAANPAPSCTAASAHNLDEIGITFPPGIPASEITVDPSEPKIPAEGNYYVLATTGGNSCNGTLAANAICLNAGGTAYNAGGSNNTPGVTYSGTAANAQGQIWLDVPQGEASFIAQNIQVQSWNDTEATWTSLTTDGHTSAATTPVVGGGVAGTALTSLSVQAFSLNYNLMAAQFDPSTVSPGATTTSYSLAFTNTTTSADANPDPVDAIVIEQMTNKLWTVSGTPTFAGTASTLWTNLSGTGYNTTGNNMEYWFGVCTNQYTNHTTAGPPQTPPNPTSPTAQQPTLGAQCTAAQEQDAVASGNTLTINFNLVNTTTGTQTFYVYAHGANGGGWSQPKTVTVSASNKSASAKFFSTSAGSTDNCPTTSNINTNTVPTVSNATNCFIYEVTNTSAAGQDVSTVNIALPAYDINGVATSGSAWNLFGVTPTEYVVLGIINAGGTFVPEPTGIYGCTINQSSSATFNPTPGSTNGQIQVSGCTAFAPNDNIAVEFVADTPQSENDSYLFPSTVDGVTSGLAWSGSNEVTVSFSLGLSLAVDPSNPGPGGSTPTVGCAPAQCTFSGETIDLGSIASGNTVTATDVVRATVVYGGTTIAATCPTNAGVVASTWQLQVSATSSVTSQLNMDEDETNSPIGSGTWATTPTNVAGFFEPTGTAQTLACGNYTSGKDWDMLSNFRVISTGASGWEVTITYTLIGN